MSTYRVVQATAETVIHAPRERVWRALAEDFHHIGRWSSAVKRSRAIEAENAERVGAPVGGRHCEIAATGFQDTSERILEYRAGTFLRYELFDGLPGFVVSGVNSWTLSDDQAGVILSGQTTMQVTGVLGFLMGGFMRSASQKALEGMCEELKYFLETGNPHPRKRKAIQKHGQPH